MDLLSDGSSSDEDESKKDQNLVSRKCNGKKRRRGSVIILSSEEAATDAFQRSVPHRRGHWAGHVLIPLTTTPSGSILSGAMEKSILAFQRALERNGHSGTLIRHSHSNLHVSLSKLFSLQLTFIDSFVAKLGQRLRTERSTRLLVDVKTDAKILVNDNRTRSFLSWRVAANASLLRIVKHVDAVLADYQQPLYYDPPLFHISIASFAGDLEDMDIDRIAMDDAPPKKDDHPSSKDSSSEDDGPACSSLVMNVDHVVCTFGTTKSYTMPLATS